MPGEEAGEIGGVLKAQPEGDLLDRHQGEREVAGRLEDDPRIDDVERRLAERAPADPVEMGLRHREPLRVVGDGPTPPIFVIEQAPELRGAAAQPPGGGIVRRDRRADEAPERQQHDRQMRLDQRVAPGRAAGIFARRGGDAARHRLAGCAVVAERRDARAAHRRPQRRARLQHALGAVGQQRDHAALDIPREAEAMNGARGNRHRDRRDQRRRAVFQHSGAASAEDVQNLKEIAVAVRSDLPVEARAPRGDRLTMQPVIQMSLFAFAIQGVCRNQLHPAFPRRALRRVVDVRIVQ